MTDSLFKKSNLTIALALGALFLILYIVVLGARPLFMPDEYRYGEIAREMLATGNWITPRLNGLLYFEKPPFGHWLNALSLFFLGENEFAVRLSSALAAGASAFTAFVVTCHFFKNRTAAYLAAFVYLTTFEVQAIGTFSTLDSMFSAILNAGIALFAVAVTAPPKRQRLYLLAAGSLLGIAFMTKGLLAYVLPGIILLPWLLYRRDYEFLLKRVWIAVAAAVIIALPWAVAIHLQQPDFWRYFIVVEHIQRFAAENAQHKAPPYYFLMYLPFVILPWFFLVPAAVRGLKQLQSTGSERAGLVFVILWAVVPFLFFSVASGKLITYILPCMVPFAVLMGVGLDKARNELKLLRIGMELTALLLLIALGAILFAQHNQELYKADEMGRFWFLVGALGGAVCILVAGIFTKDNGFRVLASGLGAALVFFTLQSTLPDEVMSHKAPERFLKSISASLPDDAVVMVNGSVVRAVSWSLRRSNLYVIQDRGETAYGLNSDDGAGRFLPLPALADKLRESRLEGKEVLIVCKNECDRETLNLLPVNVKKSSYGNFYAYRIYSAPVDG